MPWLGIAAAYLEEVVRQARRRRERTPRSCEEVVRFGFGPVGVIQRFAVDISGRRFVNPLIAAEFSLSVRKAAHFGGGQ